MSRFGPAFDAAQRRYDFMSEDDVYGPDEAETEQAAQQDFEEEMYERR